MAGAGSRTRKDGSPSAKAGSVERLKPRQVGPHMPSMREVRALGQAADAASPRSKAGREMAARAASARAARSAFMAARRIERERKTPAPVEEMNRADAASKITEHLHGLGYHARPWVGDGRMHGPVHVYISEKTGKGKLKERGHVEIRKDGTVDTSNLRRSERLAVEKAIGSAKVVPDRLPAPKPIALVPVAAASPAPRPSTPGGAAPVKTSFRLTREQRASARAKAGAVHAGERGRGELLGNRKAEIEYAKGVLARAKEARTRGEGTPEWIRPALAQARGKLRVLNEALRLSAPGTKPIRSEAQRAGDVVQRALRITAARTPATLPTLKGTEKQVAWAERIRAEKLADVRASLENAAARAKAGGASHDDAFAARHLPTVVEALHRIPTASFWIDHRGYTGQTFLREHLGAGVYETRNRRQLIANAGLTPRRATSPATGPKAPSDRLSSIRERAGRVASQRAAALALPKLQGSDKQVRWAEEIRAKRIGEIKEAIKPGSPVLRTLSPAQARELPRYVSNFARRPAASYWIDRRNDSAADLIHKATTILSNEGNNRRLARRDAAKAAATR